MLLKIKTSQLRQVIDLTDNIAQVVAGKNGLVHVFVKHTTAAITTADLDPGTDLDLLDALENLLPKRHWRHPHHPEHAPDHLLSSIIGPEVSVPCNNGILQLGMWQRIILVEFAGPRDREIEVNLTQFVE